MTISGESPHAILRRRERFEEDVRVGRLLLIGGKSIAAVSRETGVSRYRVHALLKRIKPDELKIRAALRAKAPSDILRRRRKEAHDRWYKKARDAYNGRRRQRYADDPVRRAAILAGHKSWRPVRNARARQRYATDAEYRKHVLARNRKNANNFRANVTRLRARIRELEEIVRTLSEQHDT